MSVHERRRSEIGARHGALRHAFASGGAPGVHDWRIASQYMARYGSFMPIVTRRPISGARLRALRMRRELSQRDLALLCMTHGRAVTQGQISRIEQGLSRRPYMPLVRALAKSLVVDIEDLLEEPMQ